MKKFALILLVLFGGFVVITACNTLPTGGADGGGPKLLALQVRDTYGMSSLVPPFAPHILKYDMYVPEYNNAVLFETTVPDGYRADFYGEQGTATKKNADGDYETGNYYLGDWPEGSKIIITSGTGAVPNVYQSSITVVDQANANNKQVYNITIHTADGTRYAEMFTVHAAPDGYAAAGGRPGDGIINGFTLPVSIYYPADIGPADIGNLPVITVLHGRGAEVQPTVNTVRGTAAAIWVKDSEEGRNRCIVVVPHAAWATGSGANKTYFNDPQTFKPWEINHRNPAPEYRDASWNFRTGTISGDGKNGLLPANASDGQPHTLTRSALATLELLEKLRDGQLQIGSVDYRHLGRYINPKRMYITGTSVGGMGAQGFVIERPAFFAAAVILCPLMKIQESEAAALKDTAFWFIHGEFDTAVVANSTVSAANLRFTRRAEASPKGVFETLFDQDFFLYTNHHAVGNPGLGNVKVRNWLFQQERP
ncbi:MAG: prolyl oligopeptidase family serine peptidase [Spirochaetaceae bacterium]|jgi:predicted esterase|nr:prolyl oligopeptidase family serine peptidase [Spirochaetaceae bacterium]